MVQPGIFERATGHNSEILDEWMPAALVRPFVFDDPGVIWLERFGGQYGFEPDTGPYEFFDFIVDKGKEFEKKWLEQNAPDMVLVCNEPFEVRSANKLEQTISLMTDNAPVIAQPALWWAPESIYGVPDLIVHISWFETHFPSVYNGIRDSLHITPPKEGFYVALDLKFTSKLEGAEKAQDLENYACQIRIYNYILGHIQEFMPPKAYIITRDMLFNPINVDNRSVLGEPLDSDLGEFRDSYTDIRINGAKYTPWDDEKVKINLSHEDERWVTAKKRIANEYIHGRDSVLLYQVGQVTKAQLASLGFDSLDSLLAAEPNDIPFERCVNIGKIKGNRMRAIIKANKTGQPVVAFKQPILPKKRFEFFVDYEYFNNINVDFDSQWPTLQGCEMIFMIGVGMESEQLWSFRSFIARCEHHDQEKEIIEEFSQYLQELTGGMLRDKNETALYHWSDPEVWQSRNAGERHNIPQNHPFLNLPWVDLEKTFLNGPCAIPGAWRYRLKDIAKALGKLDQSFDPHWPGDLDEGKRAMIMGWRMYGGDDPFSSYEMQTLIDYLEADCKALWLILKWLRSQ